MQEHGISIRVSAKTAEVVNRLMGVVSSTEGFRLYNPKEGNRPDLLIFELSDQFEEELELIGSLLGSDGAGEVFVTSGKADADLLLRALRVGVKEYLPQPLDEEEVKKALSSARARRQQLLQGASPRQGEVIYIMGSKGGVGVTTLAVSLATELAHKSEQGSVVIVDTKTVFGEIPLFLSVEPTYHWGEIVANMNRLDTTFLMNVLVKHPSGVHILPAPSCLNGHPSATPETMERLLTLMRRSFDYIVMDGGHSLEGPSLKAIEIADKVLFVTLLSLPCMANTRKVLKSLVNLGLDPRERFKVVVNRFHKKTDISPREAEKSIRTGIFWTIPNDYRSTMSAINKGKALREIAPKAAVTKNIAALADLLRNGTGAGVEKKGWSLFKR